MGSQFPQLVRLPADATDISDGLAAIEFRNTYGHPLDKAQELSLIVGMSRTAPFPDGLWACGSFAHAEARQNGKGDELEVREAFGAMVLGEAIIHTAHEYPTAAKAFARMEAFLMSHDHLRKLVRNTSYSHGEQGFAFQDKDGIPTGTLEYRARTGKGGRGFDAIDVVVYDEAQHIVPEHLAATSPTGATSPNFQKWWAGSAGLATSTKWWEVRKAAMRPHGEKAPKVPAVFRPYFQTATVVAGRTGYLEHTAEVVTLDSDGEVESIAPDAYDREAWAAANPAYLVRISDEFLANSLEDMGPELFAREHLTVWDPLPMANSNKPEISKSAWNRQLYEVLVPSGRLVLGVAVDQDAASASIVSAELTKVVVAKGTPREEEVEGVGVDWLDTRPGTLWLATRIRQLVSKHKPHAIAVDAGHPDTRAIVPELEALAKELDVLLVKLAFTYPAHAAL